jgi:predicted RNA binding protein with dsRBD fold (UPF0201 family)
MSQITLQVRAIVNPTESVDKVRKAIHYILGEVELKIKNSGEYNYLEGHLEGLHSLTHFRNQIRREKIRDAFRKRLNWIAESKRVSFGLNKQAAFSNHISFYRTGQAPLGPIQIIIEGDTNSVVDFLCGS